MKCNNSIHIGKSANDCVHWLRVMDYATSSIKLPTKQGRVIRAAGNCVLDYAENKACLYTEWLA